MSGRASPSGRPLDQWPDALEATIARCASWRSVTVVRETASTQDHARNLQVGDVVITGRQTAGRGRLGRAWIDTAEDGLALSANAAADSPHWISLASAIAAAQAIEDLPGVNVMSPVQANAVFLRMNEAVSDFLRARGWHFYTFIGGGARFMFAWDAQADQVDALARDIRLAATSLPT